MPLYTVPTTAVYRAPDGDTRQFTAGTRIDMVDAVDFGMPGAVLPATDAAADAFPDFVEPVGPQRLMGVTTTAALVANTVYLYRFRVGTPVPIANAVILNGATVAGTLAFGVYTSDGTTWTRVAATADTAHANANATQTIPLVAAYALQPGTDYWSAFGASNATATLLRLGGPTLIGATKNLTIAKAGAYAAGLPATITGPSASAPIFYHCWTT